MIRCLLLISLSFPFYILSQINPSSYFLGDWYACGPESLEMDKIYSFSREKPECEENDCKFHEWTFASKSRIVSTHGGSCNDGVTGFTIKEGEWKYDAFKKDLAIRESKTDYVYRVQFVSKDSLSLKKIWQVKLHK